MATLSLPEKTSKDLLLVYKYTKAEGIAKLQTADNLALEVSGEKYEGPVTIAKYLASKTQPELLGDGKDNQAEVEEWATWGVSAFKSGASKDITAALQKLNGHLSYRTFVVSNQLTIADLIIFGHVHGVSKNVKVTNAPNVLRWFDLIQNIVVAKNNLVAEFPLVAINLDDVPEPVIAAADKKKGDKEAKKGDKKEGGDKKEEGKKDKKDKKAKKEKKEKKEPAPAAPEQPTISRLDIRVGYIRSCKKHEGADSLYVEEIDLGDDEGVYRTVVSGLVKWYPLEEMQNRWVICIANLKPASMRGVKSEAMVFCATAPDGSKVELLSPVDTSKVKPGDRIYFEGLEGEPEKQLPPKKKYFEAVQPDFKTDENRIAHYQDKPFLIRTASGEPVKCQVATVVGGGIK
ncbi:aminoacyl trna synthase complex-interactingmultifunctional protein 1 [Lichtheimia corymbifera JMRC:FSU:9682]|uniref:Aminoacyl trna synthase complex-interactingmultifunctional protein 1 n=1 Tax=Lichtheimia corymbifera JMRC:FSU:9682 TaxID=1263082 RepID=A0A068RLM4_9FUNG|nr:aminoacyl trna synthase complex-interactingmultifunctional protein 1 [Lichtheimia corymbifera JMRC:FSU:9682]